MGILGKSSFSPSNSDEGVNIWAKTFFLLQCFKDGTEHTFKIVSKKFEIRVPFNCDSKNSTYVVMRSSEEEYLRQTQTMFKERLNTYRQHTRQPELQKQIDVQDQIRTWVGANFKIMLFFAIRENNKVFRETHESYFN